MEIIDTTIDNPLQITLEAETKKLLPTSSEAEPENPSQASSETKPGDPSQTSSETEPEDPSQTSSEAESEKLSQIGSKAESVKPSQIGSKGESEKVLPIGSKAESVELWETSSEAESEKLWQIGSKAESVKPSQIGLKAESEKVLQIGSKAESEKVLQIGSKAESEKVLQIGSKAESVELWETSSEAESEKLWQIGSKAKFVKPSQIGSKAESVEPLQIGSKAESEKVLQNGSKAESEKVLQIGSEAKPDDPSQAGSGVKPEDSSQTNSEEKPKKPVPRKGAHKKLDYDLSKKKDLYILKPKHYIIPGEPGPPPKPPVPLTESMKTALADPYLTRHEKNLLYSPGLERARNKHKIHLIYDPDNLGMPAVREAYFANRPHCRFTTGSPEEPSSPKGSETGLILKEIMEKGAAIPRKKRTAATQQATSSIASNSDNKKLSSKRHKKTLEEPTKQTAPKPSVGVVPCCSKKWSQGKDDLRQQQQPPGWKPTVIAGVPQPWSSYKTTPFSVVAGIGQKYNVSSTKHSALASPKVKDSFRELPPQPRLCKKRVLVSDGNDKWYAESWDFLDAGPTLVGNTEEWRVVLRKITRYNPYTLPGGADEAKESSRLEQEIEQRRSTSTAAAEDAREQKRLKLERQGAQEWRERQKCA